MAQCVINLNGTLVFDLTPAPECPGWLLLDRQEYADWLLALSGWSWSSDAVAYGFGGSLVAWSTGLGVGFVISVVRKLRV